MSTSSTIDIKNLIETAHKKLKTSKVKELCRYLPGARGGYLHHFTFARMAKKEPERLGKLIQTSVLDVNKPVRLPPTPRAPRNSRARRRRGASGAWTTVELSNKQHANLLRHAKATGDRELERLLLQPLQDLPLHQLKRQLISSIRNDEPARDLFEALCKKLSEEKI